MYHGICVKYIAYISAYSNCIIVFGEIKHTTNNGIKTLCISKKRTNHLNSSKAMCYLI